MNYSVNEQSAVGDAAEDALMRWVASAQLIAGRLEQALEAEGLSLSKQNVLTLLAQASESLVLSELAARLQCVRSNVTQLMDRLESEGLVRRLYDATDRRIIRAELTQLGRNKQIAGAKAISQVNEQLTAVLSGDDIQAMSRISAALT